MKADPLRGRDERARLPVRSTSHVTGEPEFPYLTTTGRRTGAPREIEIWFTRDADRYYVIAEPAVRVRR